MVAIADETFEIIDLLQVTSLEPIDGPSRRSGGKKTRPS
jgi:hypothetical protein